MANKTIAVIDADFIKYACACAGEKRTVLVTHKPTGRTKEFANRTEFYGHHAKKSGGWLAEVNAKRTSPFLVDEFEFEDIQTADKIENVLHSTKLYYESVWKAIEAKRHKGFIGKGESFRVERSTILKYKGNRSTIKPIHLETVSDYMERILKCEVVTSIEADEAVVIEAYGKKDHVVCGIDKDGYSQKVFLYNPNRHEEGIVDCTGFGKMWLDSKNNVRAIGEMSLAYQVSSEDTIDNFCANSASDVTWGSKSAYKKLKDCKNREELWTTVEDIYKYLYPEPKVFKGWRGDNLKITWDYVLQENFDLSRMWRWHEDILSFQEFKVNGG